MVQILISHSYVYGDGLEGIAHRCSTLTKEAQHVLAHASNLLQEHTRAALMSVGASNLTGVRYNFGCGWGEHRSQRDV